MRDDWYLCRLDGGKPVNLWGPQIAWFRKFYEVVLVEA